MTVEINGMAHVILTVSRFEVAREFYRRLLPEFGMKVVHDGDKLFYCVGARTAIGIQPCDPALAGERFVQQRVGLHHLCLRARSREDVDRTAALLREMNATIVRGPTEGSWAPRRRRSCMTARASIAHGGPQRLPTRAAPSLVRALRDARGSPPWTPWTILCRLDRHHRCCATCTRVGGKRRRHFHAGPSGRMTA
jgi:catechol 2,3-dioxygenase-like lactoylglutathione lyase family enzyme